MCEVTSLWFQHLGDRGQEISGLLATRDYMVRLWVPWIWIQTSACFLRKPGCPQRWRAKVCTEKGLLLAESHFPPVICSNCSLQRKSLRLSLLLTPWTCPDSHSVSPSQSRCFPSNPSQYCLPVDKQRLPSKATLSPSVREEHLQKWWCEIYRINPPVPRHFTLLLLTSGTKQGMAREFYRPREFEKSQSLF